MKKLIKKTILCLTLLTMNIFFLISMDRNVSNSDANKALDDALWSGQIENVKHALKNGANPNYSYGMLGKPLSIAIEKAADSLKRNTKATENS